MAADFERASDTALEYGRMLARTLGAKLHLLHVMENHFMRPMAADPHRLEARAREQLAERLTNDDYLELEAIVRLEISDNPASTIVEYAKGASIDLIAMGTHGRTALDRLLVGSVAERVVRTAPCPVLTCGIQSGIHQTQAVP